MQAFLHARQGQAGTTMTDLTSPARPALAGWVHQSGSANLLCFSKNAVRATSTLWRMHSRPPCAARVFLALQALQGLAELEQRLRRLGVDNPATGLPLSSTKPTCCFGTAALNIPGK